MEKFIQEIEGKQTRINPYRMTFRITLPLIKIGVLLFIFSVILSLLLTI
jgi:hypothetical protein